ncbi:MAG: right-handed parallel beta-helix repeat-containing protein [candidate division Zixibacteria bacterium]
MKNSLSCIFIMMTVFLTSSVIADIIHVPDDYPTIQAGIDASSDGDTILVAAGTYAEHINFDGMDITVTSEDGPEFTNIERQTMGFPLVRFEYGESSDAILSGFSLRLAQNAPAVNIDGSSPVIQNNIFLANERGGIKVENGASPQIKENVFVNNTAPGGGGVYCSQSDIVLEGNRFISNSVSNHGGAVYLWQSSQSIIHHNLFYQNQSQSLGGAICLSECQEIEVYNNTIAYNVADQAFHGGGIAIWDSHECEIYNNIITDNSGEGIFQGMIFSSTATYNDVWNNTDNYYGIDPGQGSFSSDPLFTGGVPFSFELTEESPCIDAGDPNSPYDPDGSVADLGAFCYGLGPEMALDIGDITGTPGMPAVVPIIASAMDNLSIGGLEFHFTFDDSMLEYDDIHSDILDDVFLNISNGTIHLLWEDYENSVSFPDSSIVIEFHFTVIGQVGNICDIEWSGGNELVDPLGEAFNAPEYVDGSVAIEEILDIVDNSIWPSQFGIVETYPNPFNASTSILFAVTKDSRVKIEIFDILGIKVVTLVDDRLSVGDQRILWDASGLSSGIYFYRLRIDDYSETGEMTLLK